MNARTEERVQGWSSRPLTGGYDGLRDLAGEEFSGVVQADGDPWLCMLNGKVIGVFDGRIEDFADADGTAHVAPDPAVPLLFAMRERGGSLEEQYYTKDTPISEADRTLSSGSFVGYVELSENVLSGDYYVCYYGGRSMPLAFVGNSDQLVTGDEAFRKADDEVGIYDVYSVDMDVVEVPDPDGTEETDAATAVGGAAGAESVADDDGSAPGHSTADDRSTDDWDADRSTDDWGTDSSSTDDWEDDYDAGRSTDSAEREPDRDDDPTGSRPSGDPDDVARADRNADEASSPNGDETATDPYGSRIDDDEYTEEVDDIIYGRESGPPSYDDADAGDSDVGDADEPTALGPPDDAREATEASSDAGPTDEANVDPGTGTNAAAGAGPDSRSGTPSGDRESGRDAETDPTVEPGGRDAVEDQGRGGASTDVGSVEEEPFEDEAAWREDRSVPSITDRERVDPEAIDRLRRKLDDHDDTIEVLKGQLSVAKREHEQFESRHEDHESEHERLESNAEHLREEVAKVQSDLQDLYRRVERIEQRFEAVERVEKRLDDLDRIERRLDEVAAAEASDERAPVDRSAGSGERDDANAPDRRTESGEGGASAGAGVSSAESPTAGASLSAREALQQTNLLVRYDSKGKPTLEAVHRGDADREAVNANLRLETHTSFPEDDATVDGRSFEEFLRRRMEYQFAEWLVRELPYEIRSTGNADSLRDLYDALPDVDRVEMAATVEVPDEDGEGTETVEFDVVVRDKGGQPLAVANFNDSRDPATQEMVVQIEGGARMVRTASGLRAAFLVTKSFFEPGALEAVEQATGGSLLSRDSKKSYVKLNRKEGYHLCLVESRGGDFHVNVPEL